MARALLSLSINTFCGFCERTLWHFNQSFGSSRIASSAYQKRPTRLSSISIAVYLNNARLSGLFKVWESVEKFYFPYPLIIRFTWPNYLVQKPAILRETSKGTSYQIVRWIFRPFSKVWKAICTSAILRSSTRFSSGFDLLCQSSPSFGSLAKYLHEFRIYSELLKMQAQRHLCSHLFYVLFHFRCVCLFCLYISLAFCQELLSPCFKTGEWETQTQHHVRSKQSNPASQPSSRLFANDPRVRCTLNWPPPYPNSTAYHRKSQVLPKV